MTDNGPAIHMRLLSQPRLLASVRSMVVALSERIGFGEVESGHVALAVDEALANIIRHGYEQRENETIEMNVWVLTSPKPGIRIIIEDEAPQIDPELMKGRDLDNIRPGGLGVHIINEIMETVEYSHRDGGGMKLSMRYPLGHNPKNTIENGDSDE